MSDRVARVSKWLLLLLLFFCYHYQVVIPHCFHPSPLFVIDCVDDMVYRDTTRRGNSIDRARDQGSFGLTFVLDLGNRVWGSCLGDLVRGAVSGWYLGLLIFCLLLCLCFASLAFFDPSFLVCSIYIFHLNICLLYCYSACLSSIQP